MDEMNRFCVKKVKESWNHITSKESGISLISLVHSNGIIRMGFLNYMVWLTLTSIHGSGLANFKGDQMTLPILRVDVAYQALSLEFAKYL